MIFQNTPEFASQLDAQDELKHLRSEFIIPQHNGKDAIYLCGNSLGLQPKATAEEIAKQMGSWASKGVEGWFDGDEPWLNYHQQLKSTLGEILGANEQEITVMNSLTVNLHLLLVSFYQPTAKKYKIIMEAGAFPSDQYALESQVRFHGFDPDDAIIEIHPRDGEYTLRTEDIIKTINDNTNELALVLFAGINYYTGQFFDMPAITQAAHAVGVYAGFDLAHTAGNVPLHLHNWEVDFACWCSYKYMNSGPGGISGIFVHEKHFGNTKLNRFAGWWGNRRDTQFKMAKGFEPERGADGWQVSTSPILLMAVHKVALDVFNKAGGMLSLRKKALLLTAYLEYLINNISSQQGQAIFKIITPTNAEKRGSQLSIICKENGKVIFNYLTENGVIGDWREPDVIRLSPVPLYNTFTDVCKTGQLLSTAAGI
ncbi:kynureninase [Mucilaginibacter boryungensis]|uniref:Kynureninase n=1 Tax=Mucilaginibacter boryungensis TaxID=768480 RepID=A0ABR9XGX8_9SPHI|nr:kynureninase [Mucilaginibacter boryungensis]MBE9666324.1 kynureninase [Mucilaginibacter boryungensis]